MATPLLCWLLGAGLGLLGEANSSATGAQVYRSATFLGLVLMCCWSMCRMPSFARTDRAYSFLVEFTMFASFVFMPVGVAVSTLAGRFSKWGLLPPDSQLALLTPAAYLLLWVLFRPGGGFPLFLLALTPMAAMALGWASWLAHPSSVSLGVTLATLAVSGWLLSIFGAACQRVRDHKRPTRRQG